MATKPSSVAIVGSILILSECTFGNIAGQRATYVLNTVILYHAIEGADNPKFSKMHIFDESKSPLTRCHFPRTWHIQPDQDHEWPQSREVGE